MQRRSACFAPTAHVLSSLPVEQVAGEVADELVCSICCGLVPYDGASQTPCHHLFCSVCINTWLDRGGRQACPDCQAPTQRHSLRRLRDASPLLHRLLGKVKVTCKHEDCPWRGEYSSLVSHESACRAGSYTCPDCSASMPTSQRDGHALPCLRERLQKLQAEKAEWAEARSRWQTEKLVLQHRVEELVDEVEEQRQNYFVPQSVVPTQQRAGRYGPHDLRGLARLLGACVGDQPPSGVPREEVFNAITACVREKERYSYDDQDSALLLLILLAADACTWLSAKQQDRINTWLRDWGGRLIDARVMYQES